MAESFDPKLLKGFDGNKDKFKDGAYLDDEERRKKWDKRYIELAAHVASWSKDEKARVGCVIVSPIYGRAITFSFNGFPANVDDDEDRLTSKSDKLKMIVHAEQNALLYAGREARGCHAYIFGKPVCSICAIQLIQAGVRRIVAAAPKAEGKYTPPTEKGATDWEESGRIALQLFEEAGVEFRLIDEALIETLTDRFDLNRKEPKRKKTEQVKSDDSSCC